MQQLLDELLQGLDSNGIPQPFAPDGGTGDQGA